MNQAAGSEALVESPPDAPAEEGRPPAVSGVVPVADSGAASRRPGRPKGARNRPKPSDEARTAPRSPTNDVQRRKLVAAAITLLSAGSLASLNVENVAERANLGRQTFYAHFQTRAELLLAVHTELARTVFAGFGQALRSGKSAVDGVAAALAILLGYVATEPHAAKFLLVDAPALGGAHVGIVRTFLDALGSVLVLESAQDSGGALTPRAASILIHGIKGAAISLLDEGNHASAPELLSDFVLLANRALLRS